MEREEKGYMYELCYLFHIGLKRDRHGTHTNAQKVA